jgi:transcriptional regulator with XRE-family HTH domain
MSPSRKVADVFRAGKERLLRPEVRSKSLAERARCIPRVEVHLSRSACAVVQTFPKRKTEVIASFGDRLASLRKAAGYTQVELAAEMGITQRMVAYYEAPNAQPPAHLLPQLAQTLGVSVDVLLGLAEPRRAKKIATNRLERRLLEIEKLDPKAKRQLTQLLDTFIEGEKLKRRMNAGTNPQEA